MALLTCHTYPAQSANKRAQIAQKRPYIGSTTLTVLISITLYDHGVQKE
jgi:hypothetical protein